MYSSARQAREKRLQMLKDQPDKKHIVVDGITASGSKTYSSTQDTPISQNSDHEESLIVSKSKQKFTFDVSKMGLKSTENIKIGSNIKIIDLSHNKFKIIPDKIFINCVNWVNLNLSDNYIEKISDEISKLSLLEELNLNNNGLMHITQLKHNACLKKLHLRHNKLTNIEYFNQNRELEFLDISENELTTLNECEYNLPTSLKTFLLSKNQITAILSPRTLFCLQKLENADFSENPFVTILKSRKIDCIHFILSLLLECNLKFINDQKLAHKDFKKAKEMYKDKDSSPVSKDILKRTLLMEISESELIQFLANDQPYNYIEEVKELDEENFDESPDKDSEYDLSLTVVLEPRVINKLHIWAFI